MLNSLYLLTQAMEFFSKSKRAFLSILVVLISLYFGLNQQQLDSLLSFVDPAQAGYSQVVAVVDGDTIEVLSGNQREKVRFIGLDTPETHHPDKAVQCYGEAASAHLKKLIGTESVRLEADPTNSNRDRYGRLLRYVYLEDGTLLNQQMIEDGYGFAYTLFPFEKLEDFKISQTSAQSAERGLWSACEVIAEDETFNTAPAEAAP